MPPEPVSNAESAPVGKISFALFLAGFATFSLIYCVQPLLPELSREFGVSAAVASLALSLTTGFLAVAILVAGMVSEAVGRRGLMFASMAVASLLNFVPAFSDDWNVILVARALEGVMLGGVPAIAMAYLAEEVPHAKLAQVMGLYVAGNAFGGMFGRVAMGGLTEFLSWRAAMGTLAGLALLSALLFIGLLPASRHFQRHPGLNLRRHMAAFKGHLRDPRLRRLFAVGFLAMGGFVALYNYAGFRLVAQPYGLGQTELGLIFLSYLFGMFASSVAGAMAQRWGRAKVIGLGAMVTVAGIAITTATSLALIIVGICVITVGFFVVHSVASSSVGRLAQGHKAHASSLYLLAYYCGSSVIGSLGGSLWHWGAWPAVAGFSALLAVGTLALAFNLRAPAQQADLTAAR